MSYPPQGAGVGVGDMLKSTYDPDDDGVIAVAQTEADKTPSGFIAMWHGLIANIPSGYVICDGNNSTPNLLARFVQGVATAATNPGATGGKATHTLTEAEMPMHKHTGIARFPTPERIVLEECREAGSNVHSGTCGNTYDYSDWTGGGNAHQNEPPFYDVAFIMKT